MDKLKFAVIGGDRRAAYAAQLLIAQGRDVMVVGLELTGLCDAAHITSMEEATRDADIIILPMPLFASDGRLLCEYSSERLDARDVIARCKNTALLFAGRVNCETAAFARRCGRTLCDYFEREELQIKNAVPTAEGMAEILMRRLPVTLRGASVAVTGYGRTAQAACDILLALGAHVTVCARRPDALALAGSRGCTTVQISRLADRRLKFDALVNTIPVPIIDDTILRRLSRGCLLLDLASDSCIAAGADAAACGIEYERALSLPGKAAPKTAGAIIVETIFDILSERGFVL
ncbi:MAG: dipicolinate synthase subunit DpsA [Oscillospiraceae bacterium]